VNLLTRKTSKQPQDKFDG